MDRVPLRFCDSVVQVGQAGMHRFNDRTDSTLIEPLKKLVGYWSVAAGRISNNLVTGRTELRPIGSDNWGYAMSLAYKGDHKMVWKDTAKGKRCLLIVSWVVLAKNQRYIVTSSTVKLRNLLLFGYKKPLDINVAETKNFTPQEKLQVAKFIENLNVRRIGMHYTPEFERFMINALGSKHLLSASFHNEIPESLHPHVLDWARRNDFTNLVIPKQHNFKLDFPIFERFVTRALASKGGERMSLEAKFSEADSERIRTLTGSKWVKRNHNTNTEEWVWQLKKVTVRLIDCGRLPTTEIN